MKNKSSKVALILVSFLLTQCIGLENIVLEENKTSKFSPENALDYTSESVVIDNPVLVDGIFENFERDLIGWWGSGEVLKFAKGPNYLEINANKTTAGYPQVGYVFEPKNFSNTPVVRVRMRVEGDESARVRLDLKDINDVSTNAIIVSNEILVSDVYQEYYFDFNNKFKQSWPSIAEVDIRQISGMAFFVNPGDKQFKGKIFIDEIFVMANRNGSGIVSKDILLDDLSGDINYWWGCDKERVLLSKEGKSLFVKFVGGQWSCFGMTFDPMDVSTTPIIKVRVKAKSDGNQPNVDFVAYFSDTNNKTSNAKNAPQKVIIGNDYIDYFFDYKNNMASSDGPFDSKSTQGIIVFVNTQGTEVFNGSLNIDEVVFMNAIPSYVSKRILLSKPFLFDSTWTKGIEQPLIDNFKDNKVGWLASNEKLKLSIAENDFLKIHTEGVGANWEFIEKRISSTNFLTTPVMKIRLKSEGNLNPYLRILLTDNQGNVSNGRPAEGKIDVGNEFVDYYFDFTGRFEQRFPEIKNINPMAIDKITLYINGGGQDYTGNILLDDIKMISISDYLKVVSN